MNDPGEVQVPGGYALALVDLVARWRVTDVELLGGLDLDRARLAAPETRLAARTFAQLVRRAHRLTGEPGLAIYLGLQLRLSTHGFLGFAAMTAATVRDAIALAERFVATRLTAIGFHLHVERGTASLVLLEHAPLDELRELALIAILSGLAHMGAAVTGRPVTGRAEVPFAEPAYYRRLAHLVPGPVVFDRPAARLVFDPALLDLPLVLADPVSAQLARAQCERELDALGDGSRGLGEVRRLLAGDGGAAGFRTLGEVAHAMHVSPRTLKRQLAAAGTSFSAVLEDLRRERAQLLLAEPRLTLDAIAERLGYADVTSFTRAYRRWTGETPARARRR